MSVSFFIGAIQGESGMVNGYSTVERAYGFVIVFGSIVICAWLLYRLGKLAPEVRKRLFVRQMRSLAIADIIFHTTVLYECKL